MTEQPSTAPRITSLGGGHGLYQTLLAARRCAADDITAVVTVADDGGSSGRLRRELDIIPPGDLRMALAALSADDEEGRLWAETLQHRFGGNGAMAGHAVGNLLIAGLTGVLGSEQAALDRVAALTRSCGRVLPVCHEALEIEADVAGLDDDPRVILPVRGQVAVAATPGVVRRVRILPERPAANPLAVDAIRDADLVTLGPGSWFSSVIPHLLVPEIVEAIHDTDALRVVMLNLSPEVGETQGFSSERHIHMLAQHAPALQVDYIVIDDNTVTTASERGHIARAARALGATVTYRDIRAQGEGHRRVNLHDPDKVGATLLDLLAEGRCR